MQRLPALLVLVVLAGCGGQDEPAPAVPDEAATVLQIRFDDGRGETSTATLRCEDAAGGAEGFLDGQDPAELCRAAHRLDGLLTEEPARDRACTQIFGGPQEARVTGRVAGEPVDRRFSRENGCRIAEWDRLQRAGLLPGP